MCIGVYYDFLKLLLVHASFHPTSTLLHPKAASPSPPAHSELSSPPPISPRVSSHPGAQLLGQPPWLHLYHRQE